ncbi:hypothetical protein E5161_17035 [Cohnella pontilimi]|uniref:Photosynthesis system II assembly factor Ycf48/Hcf136-like domain-containing protein n=1 Tax=Cohnella pontilimi TaxID=2564100 RepID=A0A4U0FC68_9BACL|nr:hypothetical protein [Cohnella pontilimi]TJY40842.1 hypothetical protein E5161_17035 [Cohnella pontilimi]
MNRYPKRAVWLMFLSLLLATAGCAAGGNTSDVSGHQDAAVMPTAKEPPITPTSDSSSLLTVPVKPPSVSTFEQSAPKRTGKVTAVRAADSSVGWAGGDGWIARTADGGKHWSVTLQHPYVVTQIFALNANKVWAALDIGDKRGVKLIRSTDGGKHWTDAGAVPSYGFFHFVSDTEAFSGNAMTTDGGKTWKKLPSPAPTSLIGEIYFHDRLNGWAVTKATGGFQIRKTTDGGKTWSVVMTRKSEVVPTYAVIRSAGVKDAWVEVVGGSGMTQTSYSLFHTVDGGKHWQPVLANSGAGSGPAPGFSMDEKKVPRNTGSSPGTLYVVNQKVAFLGGRCQACDLPNTIGKTTDGGKTWVNLKGEYPGYEQQQIAAVDADHAWWICTDSQEPSRMYFTSDGGRHWKLVYTFDKPQQ